MDRRLLFPAIAATAWAQQQPAPEAASVEALRNRVQQYYQLMVDKKYRQAEAMVADDSKEDYYNGRKPDIKAFEIISVDLVSPTTAKVTIRAKVQMLMPGAGAQVFDMPTPTNWKVENGLWTWYIPEEVKSATPFGKMQNGENKDAGMDMKGAAPGGIDNPNLAALLEKISVDHETVTLSDSKPEQSIVISNGLPGPIDLVLDPRLKRIAAIVVETNSLHLDGGAKATVRIRRVTGDKISDAFTITAEPFHRVFNIAIKSE